MYNSPYKTGKHNINRNNSETESTSFTYKEQDKNRDDEDSPSKQIEEETVEDEEIFTIADDEKAI